MRKEWLKAYGMYCLAVLLEAGLLGGFCYACTEANREPEYCYQCYFKQWRCTPGDTIHVVYGDEYRRKCFTESAKSFYEAMNSWEQNLGKCTDGQYVKCTKEDAQK